MSHQAFSEAIKYWIKVTQSLYFSSEIKALHNNNKLSPGHQFTRLTAFIDSEGIIRVGGRLEYAELTYESKHPAILPRTCKLTSLIIEHSHSITLHGGTQTTLGHLR